MAGACFPVYVALISFEYVLYCNYKNYSSVGYDDKVNGFEIIWLVLGLALIYMSTEINPSQ